MKAASILLAFRLAAAAQSPFNAIGAQPRSDETPAQLRNVHVEQKLNAQIPLDLTFRESDGGTVRLRDLLGKRPAILALVYYTCPRLCNMSLIGLKKATRALPFTAGKEYDVIAVSFDPRDTPAVAAAKKDEFKTPWHLLSGDKQSIVRLCQAVGFGFEFDERTGQFSHASAIMVLTPTGRVSQYFSGIEYPARDLRLALVTASEGGISKPIEQFLLYCFHYDPSTGRYSLSVLNSVRVAAAASVGLLGMYIFVARRRDKRRAIP